MKVKASVLLLVASIMALAVLSSSSCARRPNAGAGLSGSNFAAGVKTESRKKASGLLKDSKQADSPVAAAIDHAGRSNAGSNFEAREVCITGRWARVSLFQVGVPREEAVAFDVFLVREKDGGWEVVECGNSLTPDDLPRAPKELFKK